MYVREKVRVRLGLRIELSSNNDNKSCILGIYTHQKHLTYQHTFQRTVLMGNDMTLR